MRIWNVTSCENFWFTVCAILVIAMTMKKIKVCRFEMVLYMKMLWLTVSVFAQYWYYHDNVKVVLELLLYLKIFGLTVYSYIGIARTMQKQAGLKCHFMWIFLLFICLHWYYCDNANIVVCRPELLFHVKIFRLTVYVYTCNFQL